MKEWPKINGLRLDIIGRTVTLLEITSDQKKFFEKHDSKIFIYSLSNAAYWLGYYMKKCGIDFVYLDENVSKDITYYNKIPVVSPSSLEGYIGQEVRIVVPTERCDIATLNISKYAQQYSLNVVLLVAYYKNSQNKEKTYNVNRMLGYFRKKLIKKSIPTILSNDCSAGCIYDMLGVPFCSPTVNTNIQTGDFLKICRDPAYYLNTQMSNMYWTKYFSNADNVIYNPSGELQDIVVNFVHDNDTEASKTRWNYLVSHINWDNIVCILSDYQCAFALSEVKQFSELKMKKILISCNMSYNYLVNDCLYWKEQFLLRTDMVIENYFDLLGWINEDF